MSRPKRKAPDARASLRVFAADYQRREEVLDKESEELRVDRDQAIREAYDGGMTMRDIAAILVISHQRVSQIVRSAER